MSIDYDNETETVFDIDPAKVAARYYELKRQTRVITNAGEVITTQAMDREIADMRTWLMDYIAEHGPVRIPAHPQMLIPQQIAVRQPGRSWYRLDHMLDTQPELFWRLFEGGAINVAVGEAEKIATPEELAPYKVMGNGPARLEIEKA